MMKCLIGETGKGQIMSKRKTHEQFIEEMKILNSNIKILGKYKKNDTDIECKCLICGNTWIKKPRCLTGGEGCPKCKLLKKQERFIQKVSIINPNIEIIGEYIKSSINVKCKCLVDNYIWYATPANLKKGRGCPKCGVNSRVKKQSKTHKQFIDEVKIINPNIKIIGKYKNAKTKLKCNCLVCGNTWEAIPYSIIRGRGCRNCKNKHSKGEILIENYCKNNYLEYRGQYKIEKCRHINALAFDFALFNKNKLIALIEYQGKQHYQIVEYFGGQLDYELRKKRDEIKRNYCIFNNIPLIEIPYWIDDVEGYLEEQMDKVINKPLQLSLI